ncbi:MAG: Pycsar system effector family protein [Pseudomonadota bacterium]
MEELDRLEQELAVAVAGGKTGQKKKKKKSADDTGSSRGIETLFRTTYDVQMGLTSLADTKANMMISINGIIISVIIAAVAPQLDANPWFLLPTGIFLVGTLIAIVFAILAARPRILISEGGDNHKENLLFFGDFSRRSEDEYLFAMRELLGDRAGIYDAMIRNIYGLGSVLRRKYALLHLAYTSFMLALIFGVTSSIFVYLKVA